MVLNDETPRDNDKTCPTCGRRPDGSITEELFSRQKQKIADLEYDLEQVIQDATQSRVTLDSILTGMKILTRIMKRNRPNYNHDDPSISTLKNNPTTENTTIQSTNDENAPTHHFPTENDDDHELSLLENQISGQIGTTFVALSNTCRMLKRNNTLLLSSTQSTHSDDEMRDVIQKRRVAEDRADDAERAVMALVERNGRLRECAEKLKRERRVLANGVRTLLREREEERSAAEGKEVDVVVSLRQHEDYLFEASKRRMDFCGAGAGSEREKDDRQKFIDVSLFCTADSPMVSPLSVMNCSSTTPHGEDQVKVEPPIESTTAATQSISDDNAEAQSLGSYTPLNYSKEQEQCLAERKRRGLLRDMSFLQTLASLQERPCRKASQKRLVDKEYSAKSVMDFDSNDENSPPPCTGQPNPLPKTEIGKKSSPSENNEAPLSTKNEKNSPSTTVATKGSNNTKSSKSSTKSSSIWPDVPKIAKYFLFDTPINANTSVQQVTP